ncbi:hypothetical protein [Blastopirellula marina]|uniref:Uncharacterized protein n=1 Tax=Blastopirellula marina DSM 3645 TaxID=314230 RepID=A3ZTQ4_9BACT|nr:hypothetical protein [Blastopirellula marina]EAQ79956.1 hypothetical protein DSM3645_05020 [Blastopirellula marina DSM 3645]
MQKMILPLVLFCCISATAIAVAKNGKEKPKQPQGTFDIEMCSLGNGRWDAIRYNLVTGESTQMQEGAWVKIEPSNNLEDRTGAYRVKMTQTNQGRCAAILFDEDDGQSWHLNNGRWLPIAGP